MNVGLVGGGVYREVFRELERGEDESRDADVVYADDLAKIEGGDDAWVNGVGELAVIEEIWEA